MEPTIQDKEWLVVQKRSNLGKEWIPERLDLVIIEDKKDNDALVKRVIGLPGETVEIKEGQIYINDFLFKSPYGKGKISFYLVDENDENLKNSETLKKTVDHLNVIQKDMISILKKNNIEEIKSIDQKLDPNLHQAMMEVEDDNKEPGTVVQEIQKGFMMKDRLLRPSLVAVSKKTNKEDKNLKQDQKSEENQSKSNEN